MKKLLVLLFAVALAHGTAQAASNYSTGAVASYMANCGVGPDLPLTIPEAAKSKMPAALRYRSIKEEPQK